MTKLNQAMLASIAAAAIAGFAQFSSADTVVGNWEALVTPPPPDPVPLPNFFRRPIGSSGTEGWLDFDLRGIYTSDTYGATLGTRSVKMKTVDDSNNRYNNNLTFPVHSGGTVDDFLVSGQFAIDVSWKHADWVGGDWSQVEGLVINATNPGFQNVGRATFDSARPDPGDTFHGSWDATNWGDNTRTLTWDLTAWVDGNTANGELTVVQAASGGGFLNLALISNYDSAFDPTTAAFYFDNARFLPRVVSSEWKAGAADPDNDAGNGNAALNLWHASTNWTVGVPGTAGSTALFATNGGLLVGPQTVNSDQPTALGTLTFDNPAGYTIGGTGSLTLDVASGQAAVNVISGSHVMQLPVILADDTTVNVSAASSLAMDGDLTATNRTVTKQGDGLLQIKALREANLAINAGTVRVAANGTNTGTSKIRSLSIAGAANAWSGTLDLTNNSLVIDYTGQTPLTTVANQVKSGYANGAWTGTGINSSTAAGTPGRAVGYAEAATLGLTTFGGQALDDSAVIARYTRVGDANLDGITDIGDFSLLATNFNQTSVWSSGDFNYDGSTDIGDFALLAANFNQSASDLPRAAAVPEPTIIGWGVALVFAGRLAARRVRL